MTRRNLTEFLLLIAALAGVAWAAQLGFSAVTLPFAALFTAAHLFNNGTQRSKPVYTIWISAAILLCLMEPALSDDYHRYLWEGFVTEQGYSPFRHSPESLYPILDHPSEGKVNHPQYTAVYPPLSQYLFRLSTFFGPNFLAWKGILFGCFILAALYFRQRNFLLLSLTPIILVEGAWNAHLDVLGLIAGFGFATALKRKRAGEAGIWTAVAVSLKILPALWALPALFLFQGKAKYQYLSAGLLLGLVLWIPYLRDLDVLFQSFGTYSQSWYFNNPFFHILNAGLGQKPTRLLLSLTFLVLTFFIMRASTSASQKVCRLWIALICISPTVYPWYLVWMLPFTALEKRSFFHLAYCASLLSYTVLGGYQLHGLWRESPIITALEWSILLPCFYFMARPSTKPADKEMVNSA